MHLSENRVKEAKDQVETALYLGKQPYVDKDRIGIWGWSYGGYMTLMSMSEGTPVFKAGVAVAAPTDWRFYDTIYTERFMRTPKENAEGYKESSAFTRADKLHGNLLLVHGMADDNVHFQNCAEYAEQLVQLGKQFDMQSVHEPQSWNIWWQYPPTPIHTVDQLFLEQFIMTDRVRKPEWLKINIGANERYTETKRIVDSHCLHTICSSGRY